ncbi:MAG: hypothetical protein H6839_14640 [Planctomycetes bacterium]|nr:hypothetical protein [Planctomycetota bacterium]
MLEYFEAHYLKYQARLDDLLQKEDPKFADAEFLQKYAPNDEVTFRRFFSKLTNRKWLPLLEKAGFFNEIPPVIHAGEGLSFPGWPAALALHSLLKSDPEGVARILSSLPETDNDLVNGHLFEMALELRSELAVPFVERQVQRIRKAESVHLWTSMKARKMIDRLAANGLPDLAFDLADALLRLRATPDTRPLFGDLGEGGEAERSVALMKVDDHEYGEIAAAMAERLTPKLGMTTVSRLADLLEFAIRHDGYQKQAPADHSYIWRLRIGDAKPVYRDDAHQTLVSPLRDAAMALAEDERSRLVLVKYLLDRDWHVFWRIALHVIASTTAPGSPEMLLVLRDPRWQEHWRELPEYFEVLRIALASMSDGERNKLLAWTAAYPDMNARKQRFEAEHGRPPSDLEQSDYEAYRKVRLLWSIRDVLPEALSKKFEAWHAMQGGREAEQMERAPKGFQRIDGPKSKDELASMSVGEVFDFLESGWKPDTSFFSNTRSARALSIELAEDVKARPRDYFRHRDRVIQLDDPTWSGAVLHGWRDVAWTDRDWPGLLAFCRTLVDWGPNKRSHRAEGYPHNDFSTNMQWSRMCVITLLKRGLGVDDEALGLPFALREQVWSMIGELLKDPDPTPERVSTRNGTPDYDQTALNSVRSDALHCAVLYGVWWVFNTYRNKAEREERAQSASRMADIPGLAEVLDRHLDDPNEHPAVWSVYGASLTWLIWLGQDWVIGALPKLFPDDDSPPMRHTAVWTTFIRRYHANATASKLLRQQFIKETERLTDTEDEKDHVGVEARNRLALHLMIIYWWGEATLEEPPLSTFFSKASDSLRAWAIHYIGNEYANFLRSADREDDPTELLKRLWLVRNQAAAANHGIGFEREMHSFLSFFTAGNSVRTRVVLNPQVERESVTFRGKQAFDGDEEWVLDRVVESMAWARSGGGLYGTELARKFSSYAGHPLEAKAIHALRLLVESHLSDFGLSHWLQETDKLIESAASGDDVAAKEECYRLINMLGSVGIDTYRGLLSEDRGGPRRVRPSSTVESRVLSGKKAKSSDGPVNPKSTKRAIKKSGGTPENGQRSNANPKPKKD